MMPIGLASSPAWVQSIMLRACDALKRLRQCIDDTVCFSKSAAEHVCDLERLFERLKLYDLKLAPKKAHLGVRVIKYYVTV